MEAIAIFLSLVTYHFHVTYTADMLRPLETFDVGCLFCYYTIIHYILYYRAEIPTKI